MKTKNNRILLEIIFTPIRIIVKTNNIYLKIYISTDHNHLNTMHIHFDWFSFLIFKIYYFCGNTFIFIMSHCISAKLI